MTSKETTTMKKRHVTACILGCLAILAVAGLPGFLKTAAAQQKIDPAITYVNTFHPDDNPAYALAFKEMKKLFEDDPYYFMNDELILYPTLKIAETDLDGDGYKEIIAVPVEEDPPGTPKCIPAGYCPHYILQVRFGVVYPLAVINAYILGLATERTDGFVDLKAYTDNTVTKFAPYKYNKEKDAYALSR